MSTFTSYPNLPTYGEFWHPSPRIRIEGRLCRVVNTKLGPELIQIGRALGGEHLDDQSARATATARRECSTGKHPPGGGNYCRCLFENPRDIGDVFANARKTGLNAAELLARVSAGLEHLDDDTWVVLGIGSGVDVLGVEDGRGTPIAHLLGIDLSDVALRVASALHPQLICGKSIEDLTIQPTNRLCVLASLVWNYVPVEVATKWARALTVGRDELLLLSVDYCPNAAGAQGSRWAVEQELRSLGFSDVRQPIEEAHRCEVSKGGEFVCEAVLWRR